MKKRRELSPEERALWGRIAGTARPLDDGAAATETCRPEAPADAVEPEPDRASTPRASSGPAGVGGEPQRLAPPRPGGLDRRTEQRLRRGRTDVDGRLDLHGMTQNAAHAALRRFLVVAQQKRWRIVLVITGKGGSAFEREARGFGEEPRGVLKRQVPQWLASPELAPLVAGFRAAHLRHGGEGALYVQLRRPRS